MAIVYNPNSNAITIAGVAATGPMAGTITGCTAGNTLLFAVSFIDNAGTVGLSPPAAPSGWTIDSSTLTAGVVPLLVAVYRRTAVAGSNTFSAALSDGTSPYYWNGSLIEVTPLALDKFPTPVTSATTSLTGPSTGTLSAAIEFGLAFCANDNTGTPSIPSLPTGFTSILADNGSNTNFGVRTAYQITSTTTAINPAWTVATAGTTTALVTTYTDVSLPAITVQPTNQSAQVGSTATFNVTATGATSYQWKSLPPSGVSYTATDAFLRAAENPIATPWGTINTGFGLQISSSGVVKATSSAAECCSAWLTGSYTFGNKQSAEITVGILNNADWPGAVVFASTTGGGRGYVIKWDSTPRLILYKMAAGAAGSSLTFTNVTVVTGDKIKIQVDASSGTSAVITWYLNGALQGTYTDSTSPYVSGQPGMYYAWSNTNSTTITGFTGLDLAATSISGATSSSYTTGTLASSNNGTLYAVDCTNTYGTTTSNTVRLLVSSNGVGTLGMFDPEMRILSWF